MRWVLFNEVAMASPMIGLQAQLIHAWVTMRAQKHYADQCPAQQPDNH